MKILLDECVTKRLKKHLDEFEVYTVRELDLSGVKNGKLMTYCVENEFDILLTIDKNLIYQQNLDKYPVSIVVFNCFTSKIEELITFLPSFKLQISTLDKHKAYIIDIVRAKAVYISSVKLADKIIVLDSTAARPAANYNTSSYKGKRRKKIIQSLTSKVLQLDCIAVSRSTI